MGTRVTIIGAALAMGAGLLSGVPDTSASAATGTAFVTASKDAMAAGPYYWIRNKRTGKCLQGGVGNGAKLLQAACVRDWSVMWQKGTGNKLINARSRQCLAVPGGSKRAGEKVIQWPCGPWRDHAWFPKSYPDGRVQLWNENSNLCLALAAGGVGDAVIQWPCGAQPDHFWRFERL